MSHPGAIRRSTGGAGKRLCGDEGSVLPEFALTLPFLVLLVFGLVEFGQAYRQISGMERAAASGARTGGSASRAWTADYDTLRAVNASLANLDNVNVTKVVVWNARNNATVPTSCSSITPVGLGSFGVADLCNVYSPQQLASDSLTGFARVSSGDSVTCAPGSWDFNWCPTERDNTRPDTDYVGVWIQGDYDGITGVIPAEFTFERSAVYQVDPPTSFGD